MSSGKKKRRFVISKRFEIENWGGGGRIFEAKSG